MRGGLAGAGEGTVGGLEFQNDGGAVGIEVDGGGAAVLIAENGGTEAEAETGGVACGVGADVGVKGAVGAQEAGPGVSNEDLDQMALAGGLEADALAGLGPIVGGAA